jgi:hypothetical protein
LNRKQTNRDVQESPILLGWSLRRSPRYERYAHWGQVIDCQDSAQEALGSYSYFMAVLVLAGALLAFGLKRTLAKEVAARKEEKMFAPLVTAVLTFFLVASIVLTGVAWVLNQKLDWIFVMILIAVGPATIFDYSCFALSVRPKRSERAAHCSNTSGRLYPAPDPADAQLQSACVGIGDRQYPAGFGCPAILWPALFC